MATITESQTLKVEAPNDTLSVHPQKFMLWLGIASILMMFAGWTSGYLVRKAEGNWQEFDMPKDIF